MAYELQRETFAPDSWRRYSDAESPLLRTKELTRVVQKVIDGQKATDLLFLYTYVDATNYTADPGVPQKYVVNPKMDRITYTGTWRLVANRVDPNLPGYVQTLRLGFAQAVAWDEAFLTDGNLRKTTDRDIDVEFRNFDPQHVESAMQDLLAQSPLSNPVIDGNTIAGTWVVTNIAPSQESDGSYTITVKMMLVNSINSLSDLAALTPVRESTRDIDHAFGEGGGYTDHNGNSSHDGIILKYNQLNGASRSVIEALTDAQLQSLLSTGEQTTYEFVARDLKEQDDKSFVLGIAYRRVSRIRWVAQQADLIDYANENTRFEKRQKEWLGIANEDEALVMAALRSGGSKDNVTNFRSTNVNVKDNDDGSKNYTQTLEFCTTWDAGLITVPHLLEQSGIGTTSYGFRRTYNSFRIESMAAAYADLVAAVIAGYALTVDINDRKNGIFDIYASHKLSLSNKYNPSNPTENTGLIGTAEFVHELRRWNDSNKRWYTMNQGYKAEYYRQESLEDSPVGAGNGAVSRISGGLGDTPFGKTHIEKEGGYYIAVKFSLSETGTTGWTLETWP